MRSTGRTRIVRRVMRRDRIAQVEPGHVLSREGVSGRDRFLIVDGEADVFVDGERTGTLGPGDLVGDAGGQPTWVTVRASTSMTLLVLDAVASTSPTADPDG